jgi:selenocysteine lyase/cysteine desulfurase
MQHEPEINNAALLERRRFLKLFGAAAAGGAAAALSPDFAAASAGADADFSLPALKKGHRRWRGIRRAFILDPTTTYMNIGTTGSTPRHVLARYNHYNKVVARYPWDMNGEWGHWPYISGLVERIAPQFGADNHEIILSRNTTDGMCSILEGLNLQPGDEVLYTHHEHVAGTSPLHVLKQRSGVTLTQVEIPVFDATEQGYVDAFANAVSPATRLIVFSHITYKTGACLPAERICREVAVPNGIPTLIDGAHTIGMLNLDLHEIDCDFYAGSGHKWQCGPGATGILYIRDNLDRLRSYWSDRENVFWPINSSLAEYPFLGLQYQMQYIGNDNYPAKRALADVCDMWGRIGRDRIENHVLSLSAYCKQLIREAFGNTVTIYSPDVPELSSGISSFNPFADRTDLTTLNAFRDRLREEYGFIIRTTDFHIFLNDQDKEHALRISTHLFHSRKDVRGLVAAMYELFTDMNN